MDIDPLDSVEQANGPGEVKSHARLNAVVAITVSILATFLGICKVKDDNIVQAMQQAQADKIDHWGFYQARQIREEVARAAVVQLRLAQETQSVARSAALDAQIAEYQRMADEQAEKKTQLLAQAKQDQETYDALNYRDDQFDLSDAAIAIAISMLAVTALTRLWWLYFVALVPTVFGVLMGIAGLAGWSLHPDGLTRLLS